jgi:Na+-transporting NADH:ubiquinone oxidoreductase subunit NqrB
MRPPAGLVSFVRTPKARFIGILLVLAAITAPGASGGTGRAWLTITVAAVTAALADIALVLLRFRRPRVPDGAVGTGVLLGMILDPSLPLLTIAGVAAGAVVAKHLVRIGRGHVFNPAAAALVVAGVAGVSAQSWWGVAEPPPYVPWYVLVPLLVLAGLFLADQVNRLPMAGMFLIAYVTLLLIVLLGQGAFTGMAGRVADAYQQPFVNGALFLGLVMLADPPTSPARRDDQFAYGAVAAVASVVGLLAGLVYFLPLGLLAANGWAAVRRHLRRSVALSR